MTTRCDHTKTSYDDSKADVVVSRHVTSEGVLTYFRSPNGQLTAQLRRWNGENGIDVGHRRPEARCA